MSTISAKAFEPQFNAYVSKLIYASFEDIKAEWNGPNEYSDDEYQNYANILRDKKLAAKLKSRFTISVEVKQHLTMLFKKMVEELSLIEISDADTAASILDKIRVASSECYTIHMWDIGAAYKDRFGPVLKDAGDNTLWFHNQILGSLPVYATRPVAAILSSQFDTFLKAAAWLLAKVIWYCKMSVNSAAFITMLAQQGMEQLLLDELIGDLRAKAPAKPRGGKAAASPAMAPAAPPAPEPAPIALDNIRDDDDDDDVFNL